ncbi:hypothetical protein BD289DRAFT_211175 [Coniella lustricola]|uniref:Uncharacterized protein n=1 Tax=Coniella lustricola TaxID=2025994 RepID=A0A2T3ABV0_9PEZI|nr:hypothetical protein BD289DRAFT_211175 [Coniella lustricola]
MASSSSSAHVTGTFCLNKDNLILFDRISALYGIDVALLSSEFEKYVNGKGVDPFRASTIDYPSRPISRCDVTRVDFVVSFRSTDPNEIQSIEFQEKPSNERYLITQTSLKHHKISPKCRPWLNVTNVRSSEGKSHWQDLTKVPLCCENWKLCLTKDFQATQLEIIQFAEAQSNVTWLKSRLQQYTNELDEVRSQPPRHTQAANVADPRGDYWWQRKPISMALERLSESVADLRVELEGTREPAAIQSITEVVNDAESRVQELHSELRSQQALIEAAVSHRENASQSKNKKRKIRTPSEESEEARSSPKVPGAPVRGDGLARLLELHTFNYI